MGNSTLKSLLYLLSLVLCSAVVIYCHYVLNTQVVFTHLFYLPILIISCHSRVWGIYFASLLGLVVIVSHYFSSIPLYYFDFFRSIMFVVIAAVVTKLSNTNLEYRKKIKEEEQYIELYNNLTKSFAQLEEHEKNLEEMSQEQKKMFINFVHDLKNAFNILLGYSEFLIDNLAEYDLETIKKHLARINETSKKTYAMLETQASGNELKRPHES